MTPVMASDWPTKRLRFVTSRSITDEQRQLLTEVSEVTFLPMEAIGEQGELDVSTVRSIEDVRTGYTQFFDGDVVVAKITPCFENGKGALIKGTLHGLGFGTTELHVLTPGSHVNGRFLYYITVSEPFRRLGEAGMTGAAGQKRVPEDFVRDYQVPVLHIRHQRAIADYLDRETARLDALVAAKGRVLGLLAEKRRALITRAVTRGLDPRVPLRDSGISSFGKIPAHWSTNRLKFIAQISYGVGDELDKRLTSGVPLISLPNVDIEGSLRLEELGWANLSESEKGPLLLRKGDLLFNWRNGSSAHVGKTAYFDAEGEFTHVGFLLRIRFDLSRYEPRFFQALLQTLRATGYFLYTRAMVNNTFNQTELGNLCVMVPALDEERAIVAHIGAETAKLDAMRVATERTIALLKERRAALIAAAVTGHIDVGSAGYYTDDAARHTELPRRQ